MEQEQKECEHIEVLAEASYKAGMVRCLDCGKDMSLHEGINCLFEAMRKRSKSTDQLEKSALKEIALFLLAAKSVDPRTEPNFDKYIVHTVQQFVGRWDAMFFLDKEKEEPQQ